MIVAIAPTPKEAAHLDPIMAGLPPVGGEDIALVASYGSLVKARRKGFRRIILAQHGAGQSYGAGGPKADRNPGYPGGDDNDDVGLFLVPNEYAAWRWQRRYPGATVRVVGSPRIARLPAREWDPFYGGHGPVIALSWHWNAHFTPEANGAFDEYAGAIRELARQYHVIGSGHPQARGLRGRYEQLGIEYVPDFDEVCRRADLLVFDNTSAGLEFAATGRPVVVANSIHYRPDVHHGGRFWDWASVGLNATPETLLDAVAETLRNPPHREREWVVEKVYQEQMSVRDALVEWVSNGA